MALHLERKIGQRITIGDNIVVTLRSIDIEKETATISIAAPRIIKILREELEHREVFL